MPGRVELVTLVILDGWGCAPRRAGERGRARGARRSSTGSGASIRTARLKASGEAVGLPEGPDGQLRGRPPDDRVGADPLFGPHACEPRRSGDGSGLRNEALLGAFERARTRGGNVHLLGLVSHGGVHSHIDHVLALLELARGARDGGPRLDPRLHGRTETSRRPPPSRIWRLLPADRIATVVGRYYSMDRDRRWDRTERALAAIKGREGYTYITCRHCKRSATELQRGCHRRVLEPIVVEGTPRLGEATPRSSSTSAPTARASSRRSSSRAASI